MSIRLAVRMGRIIFFFSSRRRHTRFDCDWSSDVCSSDLPPARPLAVEPLEDRFCPSGGYLVVNSYNTNNILRYDETTGAFVDEFVKQNEIGRASCRERV